MLKHCWRSGRLLCAAVVVPDTVQAVSKDLSPLDRLKKVFSVESVVKSHSLDYNIKLLIMLFHNFKTYFPVNTVNLAPN